MQCSRSKTRYCASGFLPASGGPCLHFRDKRGCVGAAASHLEMLLARLGVPAVAIKKLAYEISRLIFHIQRCAFIRVHKSVTWDRPRVQRLHTTPTSFTHAKMANRQQKTI